MKSLTAGLPAIIIIHSGALEKLKMVAREGKYEYNKF